MLLEDELKKHFGFSSFRTGQREIISDILNNKDVLGVLPTGSGKSLCYQLPARIIDGSVIVVSPLISLMVDQVKQLIASGFKDVVAINSFLSFSEKELAYKQIDSYKLIYVSPEMLQNKRFVKLLSTIKIGLFVIDEAHCISQWGHEFRPDYLKLDFIIKALNNPTVLALTATATPSVQADILNQLQCKSMKKHIHSMDRNNITFAVEAFDNIDKKIDFLVKVLAKYPVPTMVYFSSRNWTERVSSILESRLSNRSIAFYHGGMDQTERLLVQQQFMNGQLDIICCTSAFGMGINKKDVRLIIHFHLPTQVESFIQEVGRAGRDGESSVSLVLAAPNDDKLSKLLIERELPTHDQVKELCYYLNSQQGNIINEEFLIELFQLTEIQWRFLRYQLEKHDMIIDSKIMSRNKEVEVIIDEINRFILLRNRYKYEKFAELENWVTIKNCRRKGLFSSFQKYIDEPKFYCCDKCDFNILEWKPILKEKNVQSLDWKEKLKELFLQGEKHVETSRTYKADV
ncbi:RecQ family ATP-dependent DNA helicase [Aquibacillus albus]|nr:ATP-dependent DNA helicase RecQ [Aquibacillus albus]